MMQRKRPAGIQRPQVYEPDYTTTQENSLWRLTKQIIVFTIAFLASFDATGLVLLWL